MRPKHTGTRGTRLLAWIGDQVRLRLIGSSLRVLYTGGGTASYKMGTIREGRTIGAGNNKRDGNNKGTKKGRALLLSEM